MAPTIEELDCCASALGELILRRRRPASMPDTWIYEVKLEGRFLMSSLVADSEVALARLALARVRGDGLCVLVGGLGLGCTAAAVLESPRVGALEVKELLPAVIGWHRRGLVPLGARITGDARCRIVEGDCFQWLREGAPQRYYDAVLIDIDDGPGALLDEAHATFWSAAGFAHARRCLRPGGVLALWTNTGADTVLRERVAAAFGNAEVEEVAFDNPLLDAREVNAIYLARA
jgi:spermidine synthase